MNKWIKIIIFSIIFLITFSKVNVYAQEDNLVNIYFFHSNSCPHCKEEIKLLDKLEKKYNNIKIYKYEIHEDNNSELLKNVSELFNQNITGTPFTIIGDTPFSGYSEVDSKKKFTAAIEYYSKYGYHDKVGEYIGNIKLPEYEVNKNDISIDEYMNNYGEYSFKLPLIGEISTKNLTLPVVTVLLGLIDGFNPCAMWVLLFLISMLIGMKDKKRMWLLGISFLLASAITYLLFMLAWLNVTELLLVNTWFRILLSLVALIGGTINIVSFFKHHKEDGCTVTSDKKRKKIFNRIKKFTAEKSFYLALLGIVALAISVNIIELACSAGIPIMFTSILAMNNLNVFETWVYIIIYMLCFFLDDLVVFIIAMTTLKLTGISTKYGKISKIIGAILLIIIGILMLFKPEWLMLNF